MASADILKIDEVTKRSLYEVLTFLCHQDDVERIKSQNEKQQYD